MIEILDDIEFDEIYENGKFTNLTPTVSAQFEQKNLKYSDLSFEPDTLESVSDINLTDNKEEVKDDSSDNSMFKQLQSKADLENDAPAANTLAIIYFRNNMFEEAEKYFIKASELNYAPAQRNLAILYESNLITASTDAIFKLYEKAALQGDVLALNNLGCCYMDNKSVDQNYEKAAELFKEAIKLNDDLATINLGNLYFYGLGVEQNYETAFEYYYKAAELGNIDALKLTANCYIEGYGVEKNYDKALDAFALAAKKGDVSAQIEYDRLKAVIDPTKHKYDKEVVIGFSERLTAAKIKTKNQQKQKPKKTSHSKTSKQPNKE